MKGKHRRAVAHRANQEAQSHIEALEAEVEQLRAVNDVSRLYIEALGEIERLNRKLVETEKVAARAEKAETALAAGVKQVQQLTRLAQRRKEAILRAAVWIAGNCPGDGSIVGVQSNWGKAFGFRFAEGDPKQAALLHAQGFSKKKQDFDPVVLRTTAERLVMEQVDRGRRGADE